MLYRIPDSNPTLLQTLKTSDGEILKFIKYVSCICLPSRSKKSIVLMWLFGCDAGHVGAPLPCNLIKLVDVAEKNYFASKGEGEVRRR